MVPMEGPEMWDWLRGLYIEAIGRAMDEGRYGDVGGLIELYESDHDGGPDSGSEADIIKVYSKLNHPLFTMTAKEASRYEEREMWGEDVDYSDPGIVSRISLRKSMLKRLEMEEGRGHDESARYIRGLMWECLIDV
jgi:hypothetical protein